MKLIRICAIFLPLGLLSGCLEVEQHPPWINGQYAGKPDNKEYMVHFNRDKLSWWANIANRNLHQNEYNRANP